MKQQPIMDWHAIKSEIERRGSTLSQLAQDNGFHYSTFCHVKNKHHKKAELAIATFIGQKPKDLWPDRYYKTPRIVSSEYRRLLKEKITNKVNAA